MAGDGPRASLCRTGDAGQGPVEGSKIGLPTMQTTPEAWLRGPVAGVDPLLQPAAHALIQSFEDVQRTLAELSTDQLWTSPGGAASAGFHVLHLIGSIDRLLTYARGEPLSDAQRARLAAEKAPARVDAGSLTEDLRACVEGAIDQLRATPRASLEDPRTVGRAGLPTTVVGLLFHTAEHAQRHAGQVVTTGKIVRGLASRAP